MQLRATDSNSRSISGAQCVNECVQKLYLCTRPAAASAISQYQVRPPPMADAGQQQQSTEVHCTCMQSSSLARWTGDTPRVLDQLDEGDEQAPRVRPVHNQPLQQHARDLLLHNLLQSAMQAARQQACWFTRPSADLLGRRVLTNDQHRQTVPSTGLR